MPELTQQTQRVLDLALARPRQALAAAHEVLAGEPGPLDASAAQQAMGIVLREHGDSDAAIEHLRAARRLARQAADAQREADVLASLGIALVEAGRTDTGLRTLGQAVDLSDPATRARMLLRRSYALLTLGRPHRALVDLAEALPATQEAGDRLWEARCRVNRSWAYSLLGDVRRAEQDALAAEQLFTALGQDREAVTCVHDLACFAWARADIPRALELFDAAERRLDELGSRIADLAVQRCLVLLGVGLADEALAVGRDALGRNDLPAAIRAALLAAMASAALAADRPEEAARLAAEAHAAFRRQRRGPEAVRASWLLLQARWAAAPFPGTGGPAGTGGPTGAGEPAGPNQPSGSTGWGTAQLAAHLRALQRCAATLDRAGAVEGAAAHLAAAEIAARLSRSATVATHLGLAARARGSLHPVERALGELAVARAATEPRHRLAACRRGLDALDEHRNTLGDPELRAASTAHARALAGLALETVVAGSARHLLVWSERVRSSGLATPPARPPDDPELAAAVAGVRETTRLLTRTSDGQLADRLQRERARHEADVRRHYRRRRGSLHDPNSRLVVPALVEAVGEAAMIALVAVSGVLYAVRVQRGRVTRHELGPAGAAMAEAEHARAALRRAAYGRPVDLDHLGARLAAATLGRLGVDLPDRVIVVPPACLHTAPWTVLPELAPRDVEVTPSARHWLGSRGDRPAGTAVFVAGPHLTAAATEVLTVAGRHPVATVLRGAAATTTATAGAFDGAAIAHVAAHGSFRADAPLFSSLALADGPLFLHDLDRLVRPPHTLLLSACDAGDSTAVGFDEGLGLVTGLLGLGVREVLAAVVPVSDSATLQVMSTLHAALAAGSTLAQAHLAARRACADHPGAAATAASFVPWR